jgi:hypothetical protein
LNLAHRRLDDSSGIGPAKAAFGSVSALPDDALGWFSPYPAMTNFWFTSIQYSIINQQEHIELGLPSADTCQALGWGMNGKKLGDPS